MRVIKQQLFFILDSLHVILWVDDTESPETFFVLVIRLHLLLLIGEIPKSLTDISKLCLDFFSKVNELTPEAPHLHSAILFPIYLGGLFSVFISFRALSQPSKFASRSSFDTIE